MTETRVMWTLWDRRECVSNHSSGIDAHRSAINSRYVSPDSGRLLTLYDPQGRIVASYRDGRELIGELDGSAFATP
jgi:hypothetical protein